MPFADERGAIELANDTPYGLVAGVWTRDLDRAYRVAGRLEAGQVYVNGRGAPIEAPFGGVKDSGYGREKGRSRCCQRVHAGQDRERVDRAAVVGRRLQPRAHADRWLRNRLS